MFDEQPDGDPHGECAAEINHLQRQCEVLRDERDHARACRDSGVKRRKIAQVYAIPIAQIPKSFGEKYPRNPDAKCKCEHWQACIDCHPSYAEAAIRGEV